MSNQWFTGRMLTVALLFGLSVVQPMASSAVQALNPARARNPVSISWSARGILS